MRLPKLGLGELRQQWRVLYKTEASPHLSRELLVRAVAYRMQEVALGGLRPSLIITSHHRALAIFAGGPRVRIHLPPPASRVRT